MKNKIFAAVLLAAMLAAAEASAITKTEFLDLCRSGSQELKTALEKDSGLVNARFKGYQTPLIAAAAEIKDVEILRILLSAGADVNAQDADGKTALITAAGKHDGLAAVQLLIRSGADVNYKNDESNTALMVALRKHAPQELITALLDAGSDLTAKDRKGRSVLDYARSDPALQGTEVLRRIEAGAR